MSYPHLGQDVPDLSAAMAGVDLSLPPTVPDVGSLFALNLPVTVPTFEAPAPVALPALPASVQAPDVLPAPSLAVSTEAARVGQETALAPAQAAHYALGYEYPVLGLLDVGYEPLKAYVQAGLPGASLLEAGYEWATAQTGGVLSLVQASPADWTLPGLQGAVLSWGSFGLAAPRGLIDPLAVIGQGIRAVTDWLKSWVTP